MFKINRKRYLIILLLLINVINSDDEITFYDQFNQSIPIEIANVALPYNINNSSNKNESGIIHDKAYQLSTIKNITSTAIIDVVPFDVQKIVIKSKKQGLTTKKLPLATISETRSTLQKTIKDTDYYRSKLLNFNLDNLENIHYKSFNKRNDDLNFEEMRLLSDGITTINSKTSLLSPTITPKATTIFEEQTSNITFLQPITNDSIDHILISSSSPSPFSKNLKNQKIKIKGRESLQKDEFSKGSSSSSSSSVANLYNSVNHFYVDTVTYNNSSLEFLNDLEENYFKILINLFDHFNWEASKIRTKISAVCGVELLAYLSALNNNIEWAQQAYDSSGHYRGQILFGNNLWLGQKMFCGEINLRNENFERKHFEFGFFVARVKISMKSEQINLSKILQVGECLPNSCTPQDIEIILQHDLNIKLLPLQNSTSNKFEAELLSVRKVPGPYFIWNDRIFQALCGICVSLIFIIIIATIYESRLIQKQQKQLHNNEENFLSSNSETNKSSFHSNKKTRMTNSKHKSIKSDDEIICNGTTTSLELYQINNDKSDNNIDVENNHQYSQYNDNNNQVKSSTIIIKKNHQDRHYHHQQEALHKNNSDNIKNDISISQYKNEIGIPQRILLCFALGSNSATILSVDRNHEEIISCVHGIRVFSLLWTIMVHTYLQVFTIGENRYRRNITERTFWYQIIGNATFSVDSFFFISGLLVCLLFLRGYRSKNKNIKEFFKNGFCQTFIMIFYRYIRLTPAYLFVITFNQLALKHVFNYSVFQPNVADHITCPKYWWRNILYINNWYPFKELCMIWSWYLANDTQFYIMAIILLIASTRYFKASVVILLTFLVTSWGASGIISLYFNYTHKVAEPFESFDFLYDKPWQRIGTYIIGMITGYIIHSVKKPPRVPFLLNIILWLLSIGILFSLIFGVWEGQLSIITTAFYVSIGHTAWGIALVWITLSCCWDLSKPINKILSYHGFLPLSRLTYCTYLIHPVIMLITSFQMQGPIHLDHPMVLTIFMGNSVLSFIIAFIISVIFEAPVIRLLKIFFHK